MKVLDNTLSVCSKTLKPTPAKIIEEKGKVFLFKKCGEKVLIDNDVELYKKLIFPYRADNIKGDSIEEIWSEIRKKVFSTVLYITSRCNLHCNICYLNFAHTMHDMTMDELKKILRRNKSRFISLTGGEPTVREDLPEIIKFLKSKGKIVYIITNGIKLADRKYLKGLKEAGLDGVYLSFDGFDDEIYLEFRGIKLLEKKLKALKNLEKERINTIFTSVIREDFNEEEIEKIINYVSKHEFIEGIRFLSEYPDNFNFSASRIIKRICKDFDIDLKYFIEMRKFLWNFNSLPRWLQNFVCIGIGGVPFKRGNLRPIFNPNDNKTVKLLKLFKEGIKFLITRAGLKKKFDVLKIYTGSIYTPLHWDLKQGMIFSESSEGFEKVDGRFPIQVMVGPP